MATNGEEEFSEKLNSVAKSARQVNFEHDSFSQLADYMEKMIPIVYELQRSGGAYEDMIEVLEKDLYAAHELVTVCTTKSQMYLLTHCRSVVRQLESITHAMGKNLELIPARDETKSIMNNLSQDMQNVQFQVKESEERICRALERETSSIRSDLALQTGILVDIARTVGVEDFTKNPLALKNQIELLKNDVQGPDDLHMSNLIGTMFDNFVRRQARTSGDHLPSDRAGGRRRRKFEEAYETFKCPLTHEVMADPVAVVETGKIYERKAIEAWFAECRRNGKPVTCPMTSTVLRHPELKPSIALRNTIEEWRGRNEAAQIESMGPVLSGGSEIDILEGLDEIEELCMQNNFNKSKVRNEGLIPMIVNCLKNSEEVRYKALQTLKVLAENDEDIKEEIGKTTAIWSAVKCLSRELSREREEAVSLLLELSKSYSLCEKIGSSSGAILILVGMTSSKSENPLSAERADETLNNLEACDENVRQMAENGRLKPLITRLLEGPDEKQVQMANYIADIPLNSEGKERLAEEGSGVLIQMLQSNNTGSREVALKALRTLSTLESNGGLLVKAGILPPLTRDLFVASIQQVPTRMKEVAATVLANIVNSCQDWEGVQVDEDGNTLTSEQHVHSLLLLISNTGPAIEAKLLQVLLGLASSPNCIAEIVSHIKSAGALVSLIQFLEAPQKELFVTSVRLLYCLSSHMGQEVADGLRVTTRQLGTLVKLLEQTGVNVEMVAAAGLLANLPVTDYSLTRALLEEGVVPILLNRINDLKRGVVRVGAGKYVAPFTEGLVAILAKFTYDLDDPEMLAVARDNNLCALFTSLLQTVSLDGVQKWSAIALENMSMKSKHLSVIPEPVPSTGMFCCVQRRPKPVGLCPVHAGRCSAKSTLCLLEAGAVDPLVACLEHRELEIVEAALQALSTLIHEPCDVERGVQVLSSAGAISPVLVILQQHRTEGLRERAAWVVERVLRNGDLAQNIVANQDVHTSLVDAFRHGNYRSRQLAERSLRHLNRIPNFSGVFPAAGKK